MTKFKKAMNKQFYLFFITLLSIVFVSCTHFDTNNVSMNQDGIAKVESLPTNGFRWPYLYYVPQNLPKNKKITLVVVPTNTGSVPMADDKFVEEKTLSKFKYNKKIADENKFIVLAPLFPRWKETWWNYTHALDRDTLLSRSKEIKRIDLQLIAMINDLKTRISDIDDKIIIMGFSASGMFANRFTLLHPDLVKASVVGSPGGWPIAPVKEFKQERLRYPVGIADLEDVVGQKFNQVDFTKVRMFHFLGDKDENDSVVFDDSYDLEDRNLVINNFGKKPIERMKVAQDLYKEANCNCTWRIYPNIGHETNKEINQDIINFIKDSI